MSGSHACVRWRVESEIFKEYGDGTRLPAIRRCRNLHRCPNVDNSDTSVGPRLPKEKEGGSSSDTVRLNCTRPFCCCNPHAESRSSNRWVRCSRVAALPLVRRCPRSACLCVSCYHTSAAPLTGSQNDGNPAFHLRKRSTRWVPAQHLNLGKSHRRRPLLGWATPKFVPTGLLVSSRVLDCGFTAQQDPKRRPYVSLPRVQSF